LQILIRDGSNNTLLLDSLTQLAFGGIFLHGSRVFFRPQGLRNKKPPNTAFSERHPEIAQNASFSRKIGTFHPSFVQTASRSLVKNDRSLSLRGAPDPSTRPVGQSGQAWGTRRVFWRFRGFWGFPFRAGIQPPATSG
jgi:hypothetical protein